MGHFAKDCRPSRDHKRGKCGHMGHLKCVVTPSRIKDENLAAVQVLKLDVIEKVEGPTSWVNPLVVVEKPNGHQKMS